MDTSIFYQLVAILAPVFLCPAIGYVWAKQGNDFDIEFVNRISADLAAPCLIFATFTKANVDWQIIRDIGVACLTVIAISAIAVSILLLVSRLDLRAYLPPLMFSNCGNVGLPVCLFAFGEIGLALGIVFFSISLSLNLVVSPWVAAGSGSPFVIFRSPIVYAVTVTFVFVFFQVEPPLWLTNTTSLLGSMVVPLMLVTLGVSLSRIEVSAIYMNTWPSLIRLIVGFSVGWLVTELFDLEGIVRAVVIIQSAMPIAVFNYLFAARYQQKAEQVASMVVLSTLASFATLPALLWWLL